MVVKSGLNLYPEKGRHFILLFQKKSTEKKSLMKTLRYLFLFPLLHCCVFAFTQREHIRFEHIGTDMGLSQSNVTCIFQDSRGFMWFGTRDGLNKYDGYKFTVYKYNAENSNSPSHNTIMDIAEDANGNLWLATWGGGLNMFDWKKDKFTHYRHNDKDPSSIGKDWINKLLLDSEDNLWIATEGNGLNMFDKKNNNFIHYLHDENRSESVSDNLVKDIREDAQHNLWIGTKKGGLNLFDKKTKTFRRFQHDDKNSRSLSSDIELTLFIDSQNQLWIGTGSGGLNLFDRASEGFAHFKSEPGNSNSLPINVIKAINEDQQGNLWIGTENGGLSIFNTRTGIFDNHTQDDADVTSVNDNSIYSIGSDDKGNMWVGTFNGGINFVSRDASKFANYRHTKSPLSLSNNSVLSIFGDSKENLWIGTDGGGLNLFDNKKGTFTSYKHDPLNKNSLGGNYVLDIFEDSDGNLWIGTWGEGITVFNKEKNTFKHFKYDASNPKGICSPNVWTITEDADKNIWIGTGGGGLSQYDKQHNSFITYRNDPANDSSPSNNYINFIYSDSKGNLWIGDNGSGLELFNKETKTFSHFSHTDDKNSISNNDIYSIAEDAEGNLWIGTGLGLNRMDAKTKKFTSYYIKDGLPSNTITGLLFDKKGNLWMSTFNGLSRFNPVTRAIKNFDTNDGLQSNEFKMKSCYKSPSGKMYFGGINGFNAFFPDSIQEKKYDPPLVFTDLQVFNKQVSINENGNDQSLLKQSITDTKELVLSYDQSVITFEFASLNYVLGNKKKYSYMLEGFDKDWNDVGTRHTATYTNLDPAEYVFKVKALDNEGNWSSSITSIRLSITPPFWMTWWFKLAVLALIAGAAFAFFKFRFNIIETQKKTLQYKVNEQTGQLLQSAEEEHKARQEVERANVNLERKNKELEQFAYVASHDMQEPLRTTSSFVELLQQQYKGRLDEKADKYLHFIAQSSERMKVLIKDLLDFSRIGRKKELTDVDCNIMLIEVLADLGAAINESGAAIQSAPLPVIRGYATEIKQLFQNLVINAIKFKKGKTSPQIKISADQDGSYWQFAFKDNGIGIDEQYKEKIFVIFQRLHTRNEYEGSGIGLAHCKKIVELHNGKIWFDSKPGEGTTFHFTILKNNN
jgi:signal transduction histidine kinase/ligand-binding sensor domain-containing protein